MSKKSKNDFWDELITVGAILGGAWLSAAILNSFTKKVYECPNCKAIINKEGLTPCPTCGINIKWRLTDEKK